MRINTGFQECTSKTQETYNYLLLPLLSHFSRVRLCATTETAAHQAPPSLGFSRQEHWSGLPFLLQCMKVKSESEVDQSCLTLRDRMECSLPGSSVHGMTNLDSLLKIRHYFANKDLYSQSYGFSGRRKWHPTPVLLPGKSHGWRSLEGCSPWGC